MKQTDSLLAEAAPGEGGEPGNPTRRLLKAYNDTLLLADPIMLDLWHSLGLTFAQLRALRWLRARGPMPAGNLAELTGISPASLARIVAKLEEENWVSRDFDTADRRRVVVGITPAGAELLGKRGLLSGSIFEFAAEKMADKDREALIKGLVAFRRILEEVASDDAFLYPRD